MDSHHFFMNALAFLAAAIVAVPLFKRLGLGSVLGYLAAGALLGPWSLRLVDDADSIRSFSEIGVVLLMFVIGLELLPRRLWEMRAQVFGLGAAQVFGTGLLIAAVALALGLRGPGALVIGLGLALSSTAFAMQALAERNQLAAPHGRSAFAILLFQDLAVIPLLAVLPLFGGSSTTLVSDASAPTAWIAVAKGVASVVAVVLGGRFLLRPIFRLVASARSPEALTATALGVVVGSALLMEAVGLSMAFGAFLAGVLLADSEYRHEIEADIEPFKGLLLGLFFMSVGMSVNFTLVARHPVLVVGLAVGLAALKTAAAYVAARVAGTSRGGARMLALTISQGGEFAFVLFAVAAGQGLLSRDVVDLLVVVVTLSMATTPLVLAIDDRLRDRRKDIGRPEGPAPVVDEAEVLIAGFGRFGQIVGRVLAVRGIAFTALDQDPQHIEFLAKFGSKAHFGDVSRLDLLRAAKAGKARVLVLAIDDVEASIKTVQLAQHNFPNLKILARARNRIHAYRLLELGVEIVNRETFFSSLEMARAVLTGLGLPDSVANETIRIFRDHDEGQMRKAAKHRQDTKKLMEIAAEGRKELQSLFDQDRR